jgi:phosphoglycerate kinase
MNTIDKYNFSGKHALIRVDFNVPLNDKFEITDDTRIRETIKTIKKILSDGGSAILMSHLGKPKEQELKFSLKHIVPHLSDLLGIDVKFANDCIGEETYQIAKNLKPGEVLLLENLRYHKEEEKGDENFAKELASLADCYVNDAFGTAHRAHASTTIVAKFFPNDKMFGYLIENELNGLNKVMNNFQRPYTAIIGGAKISSKITVINQLINKIDNLIIGGGMTYTFIKALGGKVGSSLIEEDNLLTALSVINEANAKGVKLYLPKDNIIADSFSNDANTGICPIDRIKDNWMGLDIANETIDEFSEVIEESKTILWNGPMGVFEMPKFENGTKAIAEAIVRATNKGAFSLIGGGDSVAAINKFNLSDKVSYVSTGGGALLEYLEGKELPGIKAIID